MKPSSRRVCRGLTAPVLMIQVKGKEPMKTATFTLTEKLYNGVIQAEHYTMTVIDITHVYLRRWDTGSRKAPTDLATHPGNVLHVAELKDMSLALYEMAWDWLRNLRDWPGPSFSRD